MSTLNTKVAGRLWISPPSRRGRRADQTNESLPSKIGAAGEVRTLLQRWYDLPGRADLKVALHSIDRPGRPSSKEGQLTSQCLPRAEVVA
jgi:hypothetical protein